MRVHRSFAKGNEAIRMKKRTQTTIHLHIVSLSRLYFLCLFLDCFFLLCWSNGAHCLRMFCVYVFFFSAVSNRHVRLVLVLSTLYRRSSIKRLLTHNNTHWKLDTHTSPHVHILFNQLKSVYMSLSCCICMELSKMKIIMPHCTNYPLKNDTTNTMRFFFRFKFWIVQVTVEHRERTLSTQLR